MTAEHEDLTRSSTAAPTDRTAANQVSTDTTAADQTSAKQTSADQIQANKTSVDQAEPRPHVIHGGRNLMILGIGATVIALISTTVSLLIYRGTGDIYLDRSRPGYIAEDEKHNDDEEGDEDFSSEGEITQDVLDGYLEEINSISDRIRARENSFAADQLSDDALGIYARSDENSAENDAAEDTDNSNDSETSSDNS